MIWLQTFLMHSHPPISGPFILWKELIILAYESQDKEKHSSEVSLWNIEAVKPSLGHVNV